MSGEAPYFEAVEFFYEHDGYTWNRATETPEQGRRRNAVLMAEAEAEGKARGWYVEWEPEPDPMWDDDVERETTDYDQWMVMLYDADGEYLTGVGAVDFGPDGHPDADPYARCLAANLMREEID